MVGGHGVGVNRTLFKAGGDANELATDDGRLPEPHEGMTRDCGGGSRKTSSPTYGSKGR